MKAMLQHVDLLHFQSDISLVSTLFSKEHLEEGKFISIALSELSKKVRSAREYLLAKK